MTQTTEERRTYHEYRAERKAQKARRKADKPKGIDLPFHKAMPRPLLIVFGVFALVTLVLVVVVMIKPPTPRIGVAERRSAPSGFFSHNVGDLIPAPIPDVVPKTAAPCTAVEGVVIEGGPPAHARLGGVLERLCSHATGESGLAKSIRALSKVRLRFARFARSGEMSTISTRDMRLFVGVTFARHDVSAAYIGPLLAHEGFHALSSGKPWSAALEFEARQVELDACKQLIDIRAWPRGCTDAQRLVQFGRERGIDQLAQAGFPR